MVTHGLVRDLQIRMLSFPRLPRTLVVFVLLTPFLLALSVAFYGHVQLTVVISSLIGGSIGAALAQRDESGLDRADRRAVVEAVVSGRPAGSPDANRIAEQRLQRAARIPMTVNFAILIIGVLAMFVLPLAACIRSSPWWLIGWTALPLTLLTTPVEVVTVSAATRLATLRQALGSARLTSS